MIKKIIYKFVIKILNQAKEFEMKKICLEHHFDETTRLYDCELIGNIRIGAYTYVNKGSTFSSGNKSEVIIGKHCAIGRYVHITSKSHSFEIPTTDN